MPTLVPIGTTPAPCKRLGSSGFARAPGTITMSLSPCTRVAIAHSTSVGSLMSMSSSTTTTCLRSITDSAASSAFLPSPAAPFLIETTACQNAQPPSVTLMSVTCTFADFQRLPDRGVTRRRGEPGVLPRHVQVVVDRVLAHRDGLDANQRIPVQPAHQPGELAEAPFRPGPAGRQDFRLEHDFGIGDVGHVDGGAGRKLHGFAAKPAGNSHLIDAERRAEARAGDLERVNADGDGDRQRFFPLQRALRKQPHVVRRDDVDAGEALFLDDEAVDAAVEAEFGIFADHHARGDHRPAVVDRRHRDRQLVEIDVVAQHHYVAGRRAVDVFRRNRLGDRGGELVLDLAEGLAAHRHGGALLRADDA